MDSANIKLFLIEVFSQHDRLAEEQEDIIGNGEFCNRFICFRELSQGNIAGCGDVCLAPALRKQRVADF